MANKPPDVRLTGIRASIPPGYLLGRVSAGIGGVELISVGKAQSAGLIPSTLPGPPTGAAGGDLSGTYPNPTVAQLQGVAVAAGLPSNLAVLLYHTAGATWLPVVLAAVAYTGAYADLTGTPTLPTGANPSATGGDVAVNGTATTFMRSDGAPAIQKGSSSVFGLVKVDGTTITSVGGVISSVGGGSSASGAASIQDDGTNLYIALSDTDGQLVLDGSGDPIFSKEYLPSSALPPQASYQAELNTVGTGQTFTTPRNPVTGALPQRLEILGKAGGGGGAGAGAAGAVAGSDGAVTAWDTAGANVQANGGKGGALTGTGGAGGAAGSGTATYRTAGFAGHPIVGVASSSTTQTLAGGDGAGPGAGVGGTFSGLARNGSAGSLGSGGGGGNHQVDLFATVWNDNWGGGGGEGETFFLVIDNPAASYLYSIGDGGAAGTAATGGGNGGKGGKGFFRVKAIW